MNRQKILPLLLTSATFLTPLMVEADSSVYRRDENVEHNQEQTQAKQENRAQAEQKGSSQKKTEKRKQLKEKTKKFEKGHLNY